MLRQALRKSAVHNATRNRGFGWSVLSVCHAVTAERPLQAGACSGVPPPQCRKARTPRRWTQHLCPASCASRQTRRTHARPSPPLRARAARLQPLRLTGRRRAWQPGSPPNRLSPSARPQPRRWVARRRPPPLSSPPARTTGAGSTEMLLATPTMRTAGRSSHGKTRQRALRPPKPRARPPARTSAARRPSRPRRRLCRGWTLARGLRPRLPRPPRAPRARSRILRFEPLAFTRPDYSRTQPVRTLHATGGRGLPLLYSALGARRGKESGTKPASLKGWSKRCLAHCAQAAARSAGAADAGV